MKLGFIGAGSMASALARGLGEPALVYDPDAERAQALAAEISGAVAESNAHLAREVDLVILAHKPAVLEQVAAETGDEARAVASIVAAVSTTRLEQTYPDRPVYRFVPNIPVEVGRGMICYAPGELAAEGPEEEVLALFGRCGAVIALDEPLLEPALALMSCGPAFLALVVQSLAAAGARHGLDGRQATRLVAETMAGVAAFLDANDLDTAGLRQRVATPGGLTEKGLGLLEERGLPEALGAAVDLVVEEATR